MVNNCHRYNRMTTQEYAAWFAEHIGLAEFDMAAVTRRRERGHIEFALNELLKATAVGESDAIPQDASTEDSVGEGLGVGGEDDGEAVALVESVEDIPNSEDFPSDLSYDAMTLNELREECKRRGLPYYGSKAEVALRLKRDDEGITESTPTPEAPAEAAAEEEVDAPADEAAATEVEMNDETTEQEPTAATDE